MVKSAKFCEFEELSWSLQKSNLSRSIIKHQRNWNAEV